MDFLGKASKGLNVVLSPLQNNKVTVPLVVLLVLYSSLIAPSPPEKLVSLFKNKVFRLFALFVLALVFAHGDQKLALMSTVAVVITLVVIDNIHRLDDIVMDTGNSLVSVAGGVVRGAAGVAGNVVNSVANAVPYDGGSVVLAAPAVVKSSSLPGLEGVLSKVDISKP